MKILLISPWYNCWVDYIKLYFETKGHEFNYNNKLDTNQIKSYDVLISGWADEGVKWLSRHNKLCPKYITWIRSYEFWHNNMKSINFDKFDHVLFVNKFIHDSMGLKQGKIIHNAINLNRIPYRIKTPDKNILFLADINFKKGIPLLIQLARKLPEYNFNIYGNVTCKRSYLYLRYAALPNVFVMGHDNNINKLFDNNSHILLTSPVEGNPNCIIEGMAAGLKPVVHNFIGSKGQFPEDCYWDTIDQAVDIIRNGWYDGKKYRRWIDDNYNMWDVYSELEKLVTA